MQLEMCVDGLHWVENCKHPEIPSLQIICSSSDHQHILPQLTLPQLTLPSWG